MKIALCLTILLTTLSAFSARAQSPPAPATAGEMIRETKAKALQRHLEAALVEKLEIEKQLLTAAADQSAALQTKAAALTKFIEGLERELQQLAPPSPGSPPAPKPGPEMLKKAAQDQVASLQQWRKEKNATLRATITALRETAAADLKRLAAAAEPAESTALLAQVRRLSTIEPETPLTHAQKMHSLAGVWEHGLSPFRKSSFAPDGLILQVDGTPHGTWSWLDESQGLFFVDDIPSKWMNLCRITGADTIESVVIDGAQFKYTRKSAAPVTLPALPPSSELMAKLTAAEQSLRDLAALAWQQETDRALMALQSTIQELPEPDRSELSLTSTRLRLETSFQLRADPTPGLAGKWVIEGRTLEFTAGGAVLVNGTPKGSWLWGKSRSRGVIVFTLGAGELTALGNLGDGSLELQVIGSGPKHALKL